MLLLEKVYCGEKDMKKIWVKRAKSFHEADQNDLEYYLSMTPEERLDILQFLRETHFKNTGIKKNAHRKGLQRSVRIIKQVRG